MIRLNEWWRGLWCLTPQQYFSYIVAVSFIGGVNRRKPHTCHKSLTQITKQKQKNSDIQTGSLLGEDHCVEIS
jgi:hypothetical protein